jgi:hypothetical protein
MVSEQLRYGHSRVARAQLSRPLLDAVHRFNSVDDQVEDHLLQLHPISTNEWQAVRAFCLHRDAFLTASPRVRSMTSRIVPLSHCTPKHKMSCLLQYEGDGSRTSVRRQRRLRCAGPELSFDPDVPCGKEYSHATSSDLCGDPDARSQWRFSAGNPDITITSVSTALDGGGRKAGASRTSATKIE